MTHHLTEELLKQVQQELTKDIDGVCHLTEDWFQRPESGLHQSIIELLHEMYGALAIIGWEKAAELSARLSNLFLRVPDHNSSQIQNVDALATVLLILDNFIKEGECGSALVEANLPYAEQLLGDIERGGDISIHNVNKEVVISSATWQVIKKQYMIVLDELAAILDQTNVNTAKDVEGLFDTSLLYALTQSLELLNLKDAREHLSEISHAFVTFTDQKQLAQIAEQILLLRHDIQNINTSDRSGDLTNIVFFGGGAKQNIRQHNQEGVYTFLQLRNVIEQDGDLKLHYCSEAAKICFESYALYLMLGSKELAQLLRQLAFYCVDLSKKPVSGDVDRQKYIEILVAAELLFQEISHQEIDQPNTAFLYEKLEAHLDVFNDPERISYLMGLLDEQAEHIPQSSITISDQELGGVFDDEFLDESQVDDEDDQKDSDGDVAGYSYIARLIVDKDIEALEKIEVPESKMAYSKLDAARVPDDEIQEVFKEEFADLISQCLLIRQAWSRGDAWMPDLRRVFHTVKGSGRMAQYESLGEFAWRYEALLNNLLSEHIDCTSEIEQYLQDAILLLNLIAEHNILDSMRGALLQLAQYSELLLIQELNKVGGEGGIENRLNDDELEEGASFTGHIVDTQKPLELMDSSATVLALDATQSLNGNKGSDGVDFAGSGDLVNEFFKKTEHADSDVSSVTDKADEPSDTDRHFKQVSKADNSDDNQSGYVENQDSGNISTQHDKDQAYKISNVDDNNLEGLGSSGKSWADAANQNPLSTVDHEETLDFDLAPDSTTEGDIVSVTPSSSESIAQDEDSLFDFEGSDFASADVVDGASKTISARNIDSGSDAVGVSANADDLTSSEENEDFFDFDLAPDSATEGDVVSVTPSSSESMAQGEDSLFDFEGSDFTSADVVDGASKTISARNIDSGSDAVGASANADDLTSSEENENFFDFDQTAEGSSEEDVVSPATILGVEDLAMQSESDSVNTLEVTIARALGPLVERMLNKYGDDSILAEAASINMLVHKLRSNPDVDNNGLVDAQVLTDQLHHTLPSMSDDQVKSVSQTLVAAHRQLEQEQESSLSEGDQSDQIAVHGELPLETQQINTVADESAHLASNINSDEEFSIDTTSFAELLSAVVPALERKEKIPDELFEAFVNTLANDFALNREYYKNEDDYSAGIRYALQEAFEIKSGGNSKEFQPFLDSIFASLEQNKAIQNMHQRNLQGARMDDGVPSTQDQATSIYATARDSNEGIDVDNASLSAVNTISPSQVTSYDELSKSGDKQISDAGQTSAILTGGKEYSHNASNVTDGLENQEYTREVTKDIELEESEALEYGKVEKEPVFTDDNDHISSEKIDENKSIVANIQTTQQEVEESTPAMRPIEVGLEEQGGSVTTPDTEDQTVGNRTSVLEGEGAGNKIDNQEYNTDARLGDNTKNTLETGMTLGAGSDKEVDYPDAKLATERHVDPDISGGKDKDDKTYTDDSLATHQEQGTSSLISIDRQEIAAEEVEKTNISNIYVNNASLFEGPIDDGLVASIAAGNVPINDKVTAAHQQELDALQADIPHEAVDFFLYDLNDWAERLINALDDVNIKGNDTKLLEEYLSNLTGAAQSVFFTNLAQCVEANKDLFSVCGEYHLVDEQATTSLKALTEILKQASTHSSLAPFEEVLHALTDYAKTLAAQKFTSAMLQLKTTGEEHSEAGKSEDFEELDNLGIALQNISAAKAQEASGDDSFKDALQSDFKSALLKSIDGYEALIRELEQGVTLALVNETKEAIYDIEENLTAYNTPDEFWRLLDVKEQVIEALTTHTVLDPDLANVLCYAAELIELISDENGSDVDDLDNKRVLNQTIDQLVLAKSSLYNSGTNLSDRTSDKEGSESVQADNVSGQSTGEKQFSLSTDYSSEPITNEDISWSEELIEIFTEEAQELLEEVRSALNNNLVESNTQQKIQRCMHTLKGGARMVDLLMIGDTAHLVESVVEKIPYLQEDELADVRGLLINAETALTDMIDSVIRHQVPEAAHEVNAQIKAFLNLIDSGQSIAADYRPVSQEDEHKSDINKDLSLVDAPQIQNQLPAEPLVDHSIINKANRHVRVSEDLLKWLSSMVGEAGVLQVAMDESARSSEYGLNELERVVQRLDEQLRRLNSRTESQILFRREHTDYGKDFDPLEMDRFSEIQQLSRQLAESVEDLNNLQQAMEMDISSFKGFNIQQHLILHNIQDALVSTQLISFNAYSGRLRRLVRQVSQGTGKKVELRIVGGDIEIERNLLDDLLAPLEHIIRNAVAHGLEDADTRIQASKSEIGTIKIDVKSVANELSVRIIDDGAGINYDAIRQSAREKGLLDEAQSDDYAYLNSLLLKAGISSSKKVSQLAGRGIGMDVVNDLIQKRRGRLSIHSIAGKGTEFHVTVPLGMSVVDILVIEIAHEVYAVPMASIDSIVQLDHSWLLSKSTDLTYDYHGKHYQVLPLGGYFAKQYDLSKDQQKSPGLVVRYTDNHSGRILQIDKVVNRMEVVVKDTRQLTLAIPGILGASVMANGDVLPILDISELVTYVDQKQPVVLEQSSHTDKRVKIMVVDDSVTMRKVGLRLLDKHGYEAQAAKDGIDALELLPQFEPDLILLDIEMPRMDGYEFAKQLRAQARYAHTPIIMITSRTGEKHRAKADEIGVDGYLGKPYQEEELLMLLGELLRNSGEEVIDG
ncbi:response regulator [Cardiobacteriaceae bacterium TAE3-ERU3]|nr:response regulator [Cardiobacteriaceae bacterium TAE3-ERU3]